MQFHYDSAGRVTQQTLPDNRVISYTYDANGNVTTITPPGHPAHEFTYTTTTLEQLYLPSQTRPPTPDPRTLYSYDMDRRLTQIPQPDGQQVNLTYDAAGRLSSQVFPDPRPLIPAPLPYGQIVGTPSAMGHVTTCPDKTEPARWRRWTLGTEDA